MKIRWRRVSEWAWRTTIDGADVTAWLGANAVQARDGTWSGRWHWSLSTDRWPYDPRPACATRIEVAKAAREHIERVFR